jgi:hypothetical protein
MNIKKALSNYIINFLLAVLLSFSFVYALTETLDFKYTPVYLISIISAFILFYTLISYNKLVLRISVIVLSIALIGFLVYLVKYFGTETVRFYIESYFDWFYNFMILQKKIVNPQYNFIFTIIICTFFSLFTFLFTIKKFRFINNLLLGVILFTWQWSFKFFVSYAAFYLFIFIIIICYFKHIYIKNTSKEMNEYVNPAVFVLFTLPLCIIIVLCTFLIPASPKPLEWKWLDTKIGRLYNNAFNGGNISKFDYFSVGVTGFGENNQLGGKVRKDKTLALKVTAPRPVYLKASVKDTYTGSAWNETISNTAPLKIFDNSGPINFDDVFRSPLEGDYYSAYNNNYLKPVSEYVEMLSGMFMLSGENDFLKKYFFDDTVKITFQNIKTKSLFFANNFYKINSKLPNTVSKYNGSIQSNVHLTKDFSYSFSAYTPKTGDKAFQELLRKSYKGFYSDYYYNYNSIINKLVDSIRDMSIFREATFSLIDLPLFKGLIYSKHSLKPVSNDVVEILRQHDISVNDEIVTRYIIGNHNEYVAYLVPLDKKSIAFLESKIEGKDIVGLLNRPSIQSMLLYNSNEAYTKYLQLPDTLPERVRSLASSITSSYTNQYDKVKAVEKYLSSNYTYTLSPESTPKGRDFVDYFLFDQKKGYCTYYATAMAVMLRSVGIPARYVEGYALPAKPKSGNTYNVTNERAHAWVEVYFEGFGWLPFEPTSSFDSSFYKSRTTSTSLSGGNSPYQPVIPGKDGTSGGNINDNDKTDSSEKNNNYLLIIVMVSAGIIIISFLVLTMVNLIRRCLKFRRYKKLAPRENIMTIYEYYLNLLSISGLSMSPGETPYAYAERIDKYILSKPTSFSSVTNIFVLARYSRNPIGEDEKEFVNQYINELTVKIKTRMGKVKFFIYKFILGKI